MIKSKCFVNSFLSVHRNNVFTPQRNYEIYTKKYGLNGKSPITEKLKTFVIYVHDTTGLPWWATVILSTFLLRTFITLPVTLYQTKILAKLENITMLEMPDIAEDVRKETSFKAQQLGWTAPKAKLYYRVSMKKRWTELIIRDNCHPFKASLTIWTQLPIWIFFSSALRNMAYMFPVETAEAQILFMKLTVGGFLWIPNLTKPDGMLVLPILLGLSNLAIIEMQSLMRMRKSSKVQRIATNFFRGFSIILIPISATVPSIVCLYWTTSSLVGLSHNLFMMSNRVRKACGVPDTPSTFDHPYQQLLFEIKQKYTFSKEKT